MPVYCYSGEEIEGGIDAIVMASETCRFPITQSLSWSGGKGMRAVHNEEQIQSAAQSTQREALKAFGDDRIYVRGFLLVVDISNTNSG